MEDKNGTQSHGRISPYTLSVAAEFSLKRANKQLLAMGETLESVKSELSPTRTNPPPEYRVHSRSSSAPISPVTTYVPRSSDGFSSTGDMLSDMRKLAIELRSLRESIDPARRGSVSSIGSSTGSTPLTSPRGHSRRREGSVETPRTSPRHSRQSSLQGLQTVREEAPVIEVQSIRGSAVGQPSAVVRIFRAPQKNGPVPSEGRVHHRSVSESDGIRLRHFDRNGHERHIPRPTPLQLREEILIPKWRTEDRPESEQSMISESSYHTAFQDTTIDMDEILRNRRISDLSDRISDTATIGRPITPVTQVCSVGVNTEDMAPAETIPSQPLRQRPSRAALLSNIRGCQDGIVIGKIHAAVDKLAVQLASPLSQEEESNLRRKLQIVLDLLDEL